MLVVCVCVCKKATRLHQRTMHNILVPPWQIATISVTYTGRSFDKLQNFYTNNKHQLKKNVHKRIIRKLCNNDLVTACHAVPDPSKKKSLRQQQKEIARHELILQHFLSPSLLVKNLKFQAHGQGHSLFFFAKVKGPLSLCDNVLYTFCFIYQTWHFCSSLKATYISTVTYLVILL